MECLEFRRHMLEAPRARDVGLSEHRLSCAACAAWAARTAALEDRISDALSVQVPEGLKERVMMQTAWQGPRRARWRSAAAAAFVLVAAGLLAIPLFERPALADAVVEHMYHEPELLLPSEVSVDPARLHSVLARVGGSLAGDIGEVTHAGLCRINGRLVAHLVVAGEHGPIAVLVMSAQAVQSAVPVGDSTLHGTLVPVGQGSVAIIGMEDESIAELAERVRANIDLEA